MGKKGIGLRYPRPSRPLPVYRGLHWRLDCACGQVLSTCLCCPAGDASHVEVWQDGCQLVARWYGLSASAPSHVPITAKTPSQQRFITAFTPCPLPDAVLPRLTASHARSLTLPPDIAAAVTIRWQAGDAVVEIAHDYDLFPWQVYRAMASMGVERGSIRTLAREEATLRRLLAEGLTRQTIARRYGVSIALLNQELRALGIRGRRPLAEDVRRASHA